MAITFNDIIARVKQQLLGYTRDQASITYLVAPMTADDVTFQVDPETSTNISRGLVEIDNEMILVKKFDRSTGIVTVFGGLSGTGRGAEGTVKAAHAVDTLVTDDPMFPRARVMEAINDTILATYPDLWVFGEYEFPWQAARYEYPLPVDCEDVYKVFTNTIGPSRVWFPNSSWRFNPQASTTPGQTPAGATGKSLQVMRDFIVPGRNVRVVYTKQPGTMTNTTDVYEDVVGYPERTIDMIVYGACWRLLPAYEAARLQQSQIEATERAPLVPAGAGSQSAQFYYQLYSQRLHEERDRLFRLYENYQAFNS
jgi:hypothetical protein